MRVLYYPTDDGGCGRYRLSWAAEALAAQGHDIARGDRTLQLVMRTGKDGPSEDDAVIGVDPPDCDVLVLQRSMQRPLVQAIPLLQAHGIAVVLEVDDDFHRLEEHNPARERVDPRRDPNYHREWLMEACRLADLVTCSTDVLAERYGHGHAVVIPNYARQQWLELEPTPAERVIGWTGVVTTHGTDLQVMGRPMPLPRGWTFRNIGSARSQSVLGLPASRFESRPWYELNSDEYPLAIGEFTVGVVPLAASHFNRAKSWLKGIEYAAMGVPFVASRVTPYRDLWRHGIGVLAGPPAEWATELRKLTESSGYRAELAGNGRQVMRGLTIEANLHRWVDAWTLALKRRRGPAAA